MPEMKDTAVTCTHIYTLLIPFMLQQPTFFERCCQALGRLVEYLASTRVLSCIFYMLWTLSILNISANRWALSFAEEVSHFGVNPLSSHQHRQRYVNVASLKDAV